MLISSIYPNGRQSTVSLRHLPLIERKDNFNSQNFNNTFERQLETPIIEDQPVNQIITSNEQVDIENDRALDKEASESTIQTLNKIFLYNILHGLKNHL